MEMVLNRPFADRVSLPWDRLLRAVLILLLVGVLTSYIQKYVGRMDAGKETAKAVDTRSGEWIPKRNKADIHKGLSVENIRGILCAVSEENAIDKSKMNPEYKEIQCSVNTAEPITVSEETERSYISLPKTDDGNPGEIDTGTKAPITGGMEIAADNSGNRESGADMSITEGSEDNAKKPEVTEEGSAENIEEAAQDELSGIRIISGFRLDEDGYIVGIDSNIDVTDDVLIIPMVSGCIGIRNNALAGLGESVFEIYIPANICNIMPGAFAGLTSLVFIEVAEDNPCYYSIDGVLYSRTGEEVFHPCNRME